jgi:hypothetical protein
MPHTKILGPLFCVAFQAMPSNLANSAQQSANAASRPQWKSLQMAIFPKFKMRFFKLSQNHNPLSFIYQHF